MNAGALLLLLIGGWYLLSNYSSSSAATPRAVTTFSSVEELNRFQAAGGVVLRPNGQPYALSSFMGGYLYDGKPANVILGTGWLPGQITALKAARVEPSTSSGDAFQVGSPMYQQWVSGS